MKANQNDLVRAILLPKIPKMGNNFKDIEIAKHIPLKNSLPIQIASIKNTTTRPSLLPRSRSKKIGGEQYTRKNAKRSIELLNRLAAIKKSTGYSNNCKSPIE
jgi:hypothetical protein